jgi:SAM-dependent methyltransferase
MFFQDKILAIRPGDRVLEIGPGATPHPRSDVFLELAFESEESRLAQRGGGELDADFSHRPVFHYDGHRFPFDDCEFDYVICSHVVEHVDEPQTFMQEVFRVGQGRGYLEYPLITYEYLYSFTVHQHFVKFDSDRRVLMYMPKLSSSLDTFAPVQRLFYQSLALGWDDLCSAHKHLFFEGFEFEQPFAVHPTSRLEDLCPPIDVIEPKRPLRRLVGRLANKIGI